jgi:general secretion pathway protein G
MRIKKNKKTNRGFTLIELLVVIVIIGLLTGILLVNYNSVRQRGRDAKRKSDLQQVASALEIYKADEGSYPATGSLSWGESFTGGDGTIYMSKLPEDPLSTRVYYYNSDGTTFTLEACLENVADSDGAAVASCTDFGGIGYTVTSP